MAEIRSSTWSTTPGDNNASPPDGWPEGQSPSSINNCAREMMAALKRAWNDDHPVNASTGSNSAYQLITSASSTAYATGDMYVFRANHESVGTSSLNVNGVGALLIKKFGDIDTVSGDIKANQIVQVAYEPSADVWQLLAAPSVSSSDLKDFEDISGAEDGDVLTYDATSGSFVPSPLPATFPAGGIIAWAATTLPGAAGGWLECNGDAVSRSTYADLFAVVGTTYGVGDGSTTFNLPNIAGRVIAGQESSASVLTSGGIDSTTLGSVGGTSTHTLTQAETPVKDHNHGLSGLTTPIDGTNLISTAGNSTVTGILTNQNLQAGVGNVGGSIIGQMDINGTVDSFGTSAANAHNNVQPTIILKWIIKT